jgi:hypothetical protein
MHPACAVSVLALLAACVAPRGVVVARVDAPAGVTDLRAALRRDNPGYDLAVVRDARSLRAAASVRIAFVQAGSAAASVTSPGRSTPRASELAVGDVVCLRPGESLQASASLTLVVFDTPAPLPDDVPTFVRPDQDPRITDTPGGCATETGAYRRILLTWLTTNGPYVYHALNAHRVRISDSFTHYHPRDGGFAELYLVQMAGPEARLLTSEHVAAIEAQDVDAERAAELFESRALAAGDLVYLPRGIAHRGLGGALVQVITLPGFRPGAEIGLDHHLRAIAERVDVPVPFHAAASASPVVR